MNADIVVAGAGLAGLQCARLLAARGLRVVVVDRKPSIAAPVHTTGIFVRKTWEDFPLPEEQLGPPIRDVVLYSPSLRSLPLHAQHDEFRVGRMSWLYVWLLEQCVRAGVTWIPGARVVACADASVRILRAGKEEHIRTRFVIGADGARSTVAAELGLDRTRGDQMLVGIEEVVPPVSHDRALHCFLDPRLAPGYIGWVANDGEEAHIGVAGYRDRWDPAAALTVLRARLPFAAGPAHERRGGLIPVGGVLRHIACQQGLLVGDAAGAVSPLTAGGLDGALRLSAFAAEVAAAYLDRGDPAILAQYSGDRFRARFMVRRWMRHALSAVATPALAELSIGLLRVPPFRALAEHVFFSRGSFPDPAALRTQHSVLRTS
jgi:flavin-dependent dehydrogenase